ncbi:MAG: hypothetical protein Fur0022_34920 [Anaerolineales bacterium]
MELVGDTFIPNVPSLADAGTGWVRFNGVLWSRIEPQEGIRNWEQAITLETRAQSVSEAGMNLIAIVLYTPSWAQAHPGYLCGTILPEKLEAFGRFMYDLVARYSQPPYNIKYWELGNEPDVDPAYVPWDSRFGCWGDQNDPYYGGTYYAEMLKVVYPQIKAADPEAQVLIGGLLLGCDPNQPPLNASGEPADCTSARFLEGILLAGGGNYFDGISFHAYDYYWVNDNRFGNAWQSGPNLGLPVVYYKALYLREVLAQYGYSNKYLMNTETALLCGRDLGELECQTEAFQLTKANYVAQSFTVARGEGLQANIWYHFQKGWRASGLVSKQLQPYPAWHAYGFVSQMLNNTIPLLKISEYPNIVGYKFLKPSPEGYQEIWILWSVDGTPTSLSLSVPPSQVFDVLGQPLPPTTALEITSSVQYLIWNP